MDPSKIYVPQEESVVEMRSEPSVSGNLTSCLDMQRSEHVTESCKEITAKIEENSPNLETGYLPMYTTQFLARYELLLSEGELKALKYLFAAKRFNVDNPPYQAWLVLKRASLPIAEQEVMGRVDIFYILLHCILNQIIIQVLASHTPRNVQKRQRTKKESLPEGAARYLPNYTE